MTSKTPETTAQGVKITLRTSSDWITWLLVTRTRATDGGIDTWEYMDPKQEIVTPIPTSMPMPSVDPNTTSANDWRIYDYKVKSWEFQEKTNNKIKSVISGVDNQIMTTIEKHHLILLSDTKSVHEKLRVLAARFAPSNKARETEIAYKYHLLKNPPKGEAIDAWTYRWDSVFAEAKALDLAEVARNNPQYDFVKAIGPIDRNFATALEIELLKCDEDEKALPTLTTLTERMRNHCRLQDLFKTARDSNTHSAFATFKDEPQDKPANEPQKNNTKILPSCLCGNNHYYSKCYYLNTAIAPSNWKEDLEVRSRIDEIFKQDPKRKELIETSIKRFSTRNRAWKPRHNTRNTENSSGTASTQPNQIQAMAVGFPAFSTEIVWELGKSFLLDSACGNHVCNDPTRFIPTRLARSDDTLLAGKTMYPVEAYGTVRIYITTPTGREPVDLINVALSTGFLTNLVSLHALKNVDIHFDSENSRLHRKGKTFALLAEIGRSWVVEHNPIPAQASLAMATSHQDRTSEATAALWHQRLAHASPEVIKHLEQAAKDITVDQSTKCPLTVDCQTCSISKASKVISRRTEVEDKATGPFSRVNYDLIDMTLAWNGDGWTSHFQCVTTLWNMVFTHRNKSQSTEIVEHFLNLVRTQYNHQVKIIRLDGERSLGLRFEKLAADQGIKIERTAPRTPAQNGASERSGAIITMKARSIGIDASLPGNLWPETHKAAGYILNRTPTRRLGWRTPFEALRKETPRLSHLRRYGCKAFATRDDLPNREKWHPNAHIGHLVGYDSTNIFRIWLPSLQKVIRTRDVIFNEKEVFNPQDIDAGLLLREYIDQIIEVLDITNKKDLQYQDRIQEGGHFGLQNDQIEAPEMEKQLPTSLGPEDALPTPRETPEPPTIQPSNSITETPLHEPVPSPGYQDNVVTQKLSKASNSAPRAREISNEMRDENILPTRTRNHRFQAHAIALQETDNLSGYYAAFSTALSAKPRIHQRELPAEPRNWKEMLRHPHTVQFCAAAEKEHQDLARKGTFEYILTSKDDPRLLPLTWVFKYKIDGDGFLVKHKARLCARGDLQATEEDTYAATLASQSFRACMAVASAFDLEIKQYDAVNAFINSTLDTPIDCHCAEGYTKPGMKLQLNKALYGLQQSPLLWYREFTTTITKLFGLYPVPGVNCLFTNDWLTLLFYVDDILLIYSKYHSSKASKVEATLLNTYEFRVLGDIQYFLGIRVLRDRSIRKLWLTQDAYIDKITTKFNITTPASGRYPQTPLPNIKFKLNDHQATPSEIYGYQQRVGSFNFASVSTRPDISRAVSKLSEFLRNPSKHHRDAADHLIQYLQGTKCLAIEYSGDTTQKVIFLASSDAAFADHESTRHSSNGFVFQLFNGPIHWAATKQNTVTTSSTEAELLALTLAAKELIWWKRFFEAIDLDIEQDTTIFCDNLQTIRLLKQETLKLQTKLKHVDIHQSWLRQEVQNGNITVLWQPTAQMVADGLTKELPGQKHQEFVRQLNLVDITNLLLDLKVDNTNSINLTAKDRVSSD
jgi:hypothetical protein